jgi:hypothetical protein
MSFLRVWPMTIALQLLFACSATADERGDVSRPAKVFTVVGTEQVVTVRHQGIWNRWLCELTERSTHLVG